MILSGPNIALNREQTVPFFDIAIEGERGETKSRRGRLTKEEVLFRYPWGAQTGQSNSSSSKPAAKSSRDLTKKERGSGFNADSVFATNSGTYAKQAPQEENDTTRDRACNSPTRLALAETKNKTFFIKERKDNDDKGSKVEERR